MRILQLITGLGRGGAEQVVLDLAARLDQKHYCCSICSILDVSGEQGANVARLIDAGADVTSLGVTSKWQYRRAAVTLERLLRDRTPDILHCHMFHANVLGRRVGHRVGAPAVIATVHIAERRWRPWRFWLERRTDPLGTITVCVSDAVLEFQSRKTHLPRSRFTVIHNGIDTARYASPLRPRADVRRELGVDEDAKLIGSVGRLDPQKGYRYLVAAFAELARRDSDVELVIAGDGSEMGVLRSLAERSSCANRVHLPGLRDDVPDLLHAFDVFAMPSLYEGLPLALVEAMAAGVPIVASAVDSIPEVLGTFGWLVPPRDTGRLAEALGDALAAPDRELAARAQARAREEFDVRTMVARYAELYDSLACQTVESQPPSA